MKRVILPLVLCAALSGCVEPIECPFKFTNGEFVYHRLTGQRFVVINGEDPFTNIHFGRCTIVVQTEKGQAGISSFAVQREPVE